MKAIAPRPHGKLGAADSGGWSSAITPACPFSTAQDSGVWPYISGLSGLTSSRASSIFTIPSCPSRAAHQSGVRPLTLGLSGLTSSRASSAQCSQSSGAPVGPGGGTAKSPGRDGTTKCRPSSSLNFQDGRH